MGAACGCEDGHDAHEVSKDLNRQKKKGRSGGGPVFTEDQDEFKYLEPKDLESEAV